MRMTGSAGMEAALWATVISLETLIMEVLALQVVMEKQGELILLLVKLWQGSLGSEMGVGSGGGAGVNMYCNNGLGITYVPNEKTPKVKVVTEDQNWQDMLS